MSDLTRTATAQTTHPSQSPAPSGLLQRQCACGQHTAAGGECAACRPKRQGALQRSPSGLAINRPGDRYEQEAERVAATVISGGELPGRTLSSAPALRRDGPPPAPSPRDPSADERRKYPGTSLPDLGFNEPKNDQHVQQPSEKTETNEDRLGAAGEGLLDPWSATKLGKEVSDQIERFGAPFVATLGSTVVSISAAISTVAAIFTPMYIRNEEIPIQPPAIKIAPGLKVRLTYKGPAQAPTDASVTFIYEPQEAKKPQESDTDRTRAETERMAADQAKFQKGARTPAERAAEQRQLDAIVRGRQAQSGSILGIPGLTPRRDDRMLQRDAAGSKDLAVAPPIVHDVLSSPGQPLDLATRSFMEPRFGHDFSGVRVHTDGRAAASARDVSANAYTVGHNVVFGAGRFAPETQEGRRLIAHELTHVVQQLPGEIAPAMSAAAEPEAQMASVSSASVHDIPSILPEAGLRLARQEESLDSPAVAPLAANPLTIPQEGIDMPWVGQGKPHSELGYLRDSNFFWKEYVKRWPHHLSSVNLAKVGKTLPIVDDTWIQHHPEHASYKGQPLEHHHVGQGSRAVPLPEKLHDAYTVFHPKRQVVGEGSKPLKPLASRPTGADAQREVNRHVREGRIPVADPKNPPQTPDVPLSSEVAGVPPSQRRPIDPVTGKVIDKPLVAAPPTPTAVKPVTPISGPPSALAAPPKPNVEAKPTAVANKPTTTTPKQAIGLGTEPPVIGAKPPIATPKPATGLVTEPSVPSTKSIAGTANARMAGGSIAFLGLGALAMYLRGKLNERVIETQMKGLQPDIVKQLESKRNEVAQIQSSKVPVYANVKITITVTSTPSETSALPLRDQVYDLPVVTLDGVTISNKEINEPGIMRKERHFGYNVEYHAFTYSLTENQLRLVLGMTQ